MRENFLMFCIPVALQFTISKEMSFDAADVLATILVAGMAFVIFLAGIGYLKRRNQSNIRPLDEDYE